VVYHSLSFRLRLDESVDDMKVNQMKRKCLAVGIILLFVGTGIIPGIAQDIEKPLPTSRGSWLYVGGSGPGNYTRIQDAIDNASDGDTVFVYSQGSPYFENLMVNRSISLIGEDKNSTIIDAGNIGNGVILHSDDIVLSGFTFQNANESWEVALVKLFSNDSIISNNIVNGAKPDYSIYVGIEVRGARNLIIENLAYDNWVGIDLEQASSNIISNNTIFHSPYGIYASESPYNVITGNTIFDCSTYLVDLEDSSDYCQVTGNRLYEGSAGVWVISTSNISIINNTMYNLGAGVEIGSSIVSGFFHNISQNRIYDCGSGIQMYYGTSSIISGNRIWNCTGSGIIDVDGSYEILSRNIVTSCEIGINIVSPEKDNLVSRNELGGNRIGIYTEIHYNAVKVTENNLIDNNRSIFFNQVFPYLGQVPGNLAIDGNYYSDRHGSGPKLLFGWIIILEMFIFPYLYFHIPFPRLLCDWHPAQEPYDIGG